MASTHLTTNGKLSDAARHVVLPAGITSTGWPAVRDRCAGFGVTFDPWQDGAGRAILAKTADGKYACTVGGAVMSIPRQVGKTYLVGAIAFALCLQFPGLTVLWTAHRMKTAGETFLKMQAFAGKKRVKPHVKQITVGSGDEVIYFDNGSRIVFGARERGFGRGWDNVDVEVFDEAQILTDNALDDMVPATNVAPNPLLLFIGTPPKPDDASEVFSRKRAECLSGDSDDTLYIEFSADRGCKPDDRKQWARANPSYPSRTNETSMLRLKKQLTAESFIREGLGVWDDDTMSGEIPNWADLEFIDGEDPEIVRNMAWGLSVSPIHQGVQWASLGAAGRTVDGLIAVELVDRRRGTRWVAPTAKQWQDKMREATGRIVPLRVHATDASSSVIADLVTAGVEIEEVSQSDAARATGALLSYAAGDGTLDEGNPTGPPVLRHRGQPALTKAVESAVLRTTPAGAQSWDARKSSVEITPLSAVTVALSGVVMAPAQYEQPLVAFR